MDSALCDVVITLDTLLMKKKKGRVVVKLLVKLCIFGQPRYFSYFCHF